MESMTIDTINETAEFKEWHEYDDNGHLIHYRDSDGHEDWKEFDDNGNVIHHKTFEGIDK